MTFIELLLWLRIVLKHHSSKAAALPKCKTYEDWLKIRKVQWHFTNRPANCKDGTLDAVLAINDAEIAEDHG